MHRTMRATALAFATSGFLLAGGVAHAETMKECSLKYQAAKKAGTLNGADWKSFRAAQCGTTSPMAATDAGAVTPGAGKSATPAATTTPSATTTAAPASTTTPTAAPAPTTVPAGPGKSAAAAPVATGNVVFPGTVSPKYASLSAGKARMKSCVDQYKINKSSGGNGGLKWIQKGGGYYSLCSKKLKGA